MSIISSYLAQSVTHERATGVDANGQASYAAGVARYGRVEERLRLVANGQGEIMQSVAQLWLENDSSNPIGPDDRITHGGQVWHVIATEKPIQVAGSVPFVRAYLGA